MRREAAALSRVCLLYFLLTIGVLGFFLGYLCGAPLLLVGRFYRPAWRLGGRVMRWGIDGLMRLQPWLRIEGEVRLPERCLTISNHRSHLDMFLLLARVRNIRAVAKADLFRIPLLGPMMYVLRQFPIDRGNVESYWQTMDAAVLAAKEGDPVHVFPEMTRCEPGHVGTDTFHLAPFRVALRAGVPVVPIVIHGTDRCWPKGHVGCFPGSVRIESLEPVSPTGYSDAAQLRDDVRRRIDDRLRELAP